MHRRWRDVSFSDPKITFISDAIQGIHTNRKRIRYDGSPEGYRRPGRDHWLGMGWQLRTTWSTYRTRSQYDGSPEGYRRPGRDHWLGMGGQLRLDKRRLLAPDQALNFTSVPSFLSMVRTSQTGATQSVLSPLVHWEAGLGFGSFGLPLSRLPARQATSLRPQEIRLVVPDLVHSFVPSVLSMVRTSQTGATQSVLSPLVHWEAGLGFRFFCFRLFCSPTRLNSTPVLTRPLSGSAETSRGAHQCSVPLIQTMDDRHHHWRTSSSMIFEFDIHSG